MCLALSSFVVVVVLSFTYFYDFSCVCHLAICHKYLLYVSSQSTQTQKIQSSGIHQWNSNFFLLFCCKKKKLGSSGCFSFLINLPDAEYILLDVFRIFVFMLVECVACLLWNNNMTNFLYTSTFGSYCNFYAREKSQQNKIENRKVIEYSVIVLYVQLWHISDKIHQGVHITYVQHYGDGRKKRSIYFLFLSI